MVLFYLAPNQHRPTNQQYVFFSHNKSSSVTRHQPTE
jgi:hypothetical protein